MQRYAKFIIVLLLIALCCYYIILYRSTVAVYAYTLEKVQDEQYDLYRDIVARGQAEASRGRASRMMEITACTCGPESTGKYPGHPAYGVTSSGYRLTDADAWRVAAADPDILPPGSKVQIQGIGTVTIVDTGGAVRGDHIDVFVGMDAVAEAMEFGRQERAVMMR